MTQEKLISLNEVLNWIERRFEDESVLDEYRGIMVRGVQARYTTIEELKVELIELANKYLEK
jgi:hypothetical protein